MTENKLPAGVIEIPLDRKVFDVPGDKNCYYVSVQVLLPEGLLPTHAVAASAPAGQSPTPVPSAIHPCQVDTGSCGIVVPAYLFYADGDMNNDLLPGVTQGSAVKVTYQPSSDDLEGFRYTVERLGIGVGEDGTCAFVAENVNLIGATNATRAEGMMGVGFGRPLMGTNVFLNAPGMADGSVNPSFLLTETGIWLGYRKENLPDAGNYKFQQLTPESSVAISLGLGRPPNSPEWLGPQVKISFKASSDDKPKSFLGDGLLDTGVNLMMLSLDDENWQKSIESGSKITIAVPGADSHDILSYDLTVTGSKQQKVGRDKTAKVYTVEGPSKMNPVFILPRSDTKNFVNTGINVIKGADYYFDAKLGQVGFNTKLQS